jgi:hypothetical protein
VTAPSHDRPALISIIVPVFNEQATVAAVISRLLAIDLPAPREIIVVNDGSSDGTRAVLDALPELPFVTVVHSGRNHGKGHAIRQGFARARGTVLAIQDADLELDPAQLASLVAPILDGSSDVVYGSRFLTSRPAAPRTTIAANRVLTALTNLVFGSSITDMETCYKIMRADVVRRLELTADRFDIEPEITARLLRAGYRIDERPVTFTPRSRAAGKKIGWRDAVSAVRVLLQLRPAGAFLTRFLLLLTFGALLAAVGIAVTGGFTIYPGGFRIRAHSPVFPVIIAAGLVAMALAQGRTRLDGRPTQRRSDSGVGASRVRCRNTRVLSALRGLRRLVVLAIRAPGHCGSARAERRSADRTGRAVTRRMASARRWTLGWNARRLLHRRRNGAAGLPAACAGEPVQDRRRIRRRPAAA